MREGQVSGLTAILDATDDPDDVLHVSLTRRDLAITVTGVQMIREQAGELLDPEVLALVWKLAAYAEAQGFIDLGAVLDIDIED